MSDLTKVDKIALFLMKAEKAAAHVHQLKDKDKLARKVLELTPKGAIIYCPQMTKSEKAAVVKLSGVVSDYNSAGVAIEEVSAAIAETGSIVCESREGRSVQASLLPVQHIAIVPREKILATLDEFFIKYASSLPSNITLITGPSRTADIDPELTIGVHGPERLDIIIV